MITKKFRRHILPSWLILAGTISSCSAAAIDVNETLPRFDGTLYQSIPSPPPLFEVGTFNSIPAGNSIASGTIRGSFGNSNSPTSAGVNVFLGDGGNPSNDILVAQCVMVDDCAANIDVSHPWSHLFSLADIAALSAFKGPLVLSAIQTAPVYVRLGVTTLEAQTVPDHCSILLLSFGLISLPLRLLRCRRVF
jgi:hypothetical protein